MAERPENRYSTTAPFVPQIGDPNPFRGLKPRLVRTLPGYVEHTLAPSDRLDTLALSYFGDPRLWWAIAQANPAVFFPADLVYRANSEEVPVAAFGTMPAKAGTKILIPRKPETST
ncbi:hypothetical protein [Hoeflea ulvae]|uniref:LysM domain-containing protein n=1 Tax=Hoeflea ulvae TaxID=2983764 RepID=A0ABT3YLD4_9HYPH|nr:hypothetical protein [Hoeflea ulvae]MCY0096584.1 hypothetical protein [Hoeflea ulvae]